MAEHPTPWTVAPGPGAPKSGPAPESGPPSAPAVAPPARPPVFRPPPPPFRLATPEGVDVRLDLADAGLRLAALLIDLCLQVVLAVVVGLVTGVLASALGAQLGGLLATIVYSSLFLALLVGYPMAWELLNDGRSPGAIATGLRVVRVDGRRIDATASLARNASRLLEIFLLYVPAAILVGTTRHNQRLGDLVGGTLVVRAPRVPRRVLSDRAQAEATAQARATS